MGFSLQEFKMSHFSSSQMTYLLNCDVGRRSQLLCSAVSLAGKSDTHHKAQNISHGIWRTLVERNPQELKLNEIILSIFRHLHFLEIV